MRNLYKENERIIRDRLPNIHCMRCGMSKILTDEEIDLIKACSRMNCPECKELINFNGISIYSLIDTKTCLTDWV